MNNKKSTSPALPWILRFYTVFGSWVDYAIPSLLAWRLSRGKEQRDRLGERRGFASRIRPDGKLIWFHAASVGEMLSILPLVERLAQLNISILVTTGTLTSATLARSRLPQGVIHQFVPVDTPQAVARFYAHWQPNLAIFCESELWPTLTMTAHQRGIPLGVINGRMSARSFRRWMHPLLRDTAKTLLSPFAFCLAQSEGDQERYEALGAPALVAGNLKYEAAALPCDREDLNELQKVIGTRPVFLASSTHAGEEEQIVATAREVMRAMPDLLTILVPRHPARAGEILRLEPSAISRNAGGLPHKNLSFYLVDTMGELGLFYRLATLALIGGSLVQHGGQNPIEAAKLGCPVLHGPYTHNFEQIYADFDAAGAAIRITTQDDLSTLVLRLLQDSSKRRAMVEAAHILVEKKSGAFQLTMRELAQHLVRIGVTRP